jgi:hypothetical protein
MSKPGIKTTEFWLTAFKACVGLTLAIGVSLGYLSPEVDAEGIGRHIDKIVSGVVAVVGLFVSGMAVSNYNLGRAQVKSTEVANAPEPVEAEEADAVGFIVQEGDDEDDDDDEDGGVWSGPPSVSLDGNVPIGLRPVGFSGAEVPGSAGGVYCGDDRVIGTQTTGVD